MDPRTDSDNYLQFVVCLVSINQNLFSVKNNQSLEFNVFIWNNEKKLS